MLAHCHSDKHAKQNKKTLHNLIAYYFYHMCHICPSNSRYFFAISRFFRSRDHGRWSMLKFLTYYIQHVNVVEKRTCFLYMHRTLINCVKLKTTCSTVVYREDCLARSNCFVYNIFVCNIVISLAIPYYLLRSPVQWKFVCLGIIKNLEISQSIYIGTVLVPALSYYSEEDCKQIE